MVCLGFSIWWRYRAQWGALKQFEGTVHGAHGKPLQIAGRTQHLDIQWGEACGRASFIVIVGLESPPCLIGMDIMRPLRVHIDVTNGTATPAQPDPQTVHLNAAQSQQQRKEMPLPGTGISAPPIAETPFPATALPSELPPSAPLSTAPPCTATPHTASRARLLQTADIPPRRLASFAAPIRGLPRTSSSAPMTLYRPL